jgi:[acyl-carrier-protein] S-malonyltransferase
MIDTKSHHWAFAFPGQGSQSIGMLADIALEFKEVEQSFDQASTVLGFDLWQLSQKGPAEQLNQTEHTQAALLAASYAIWQILVNKKGMRPKILAGHSLGEYTALVCAKALDFTDAISLVAARGRYMQEAVEGSAGAMAALVGLDEQQVYAVCDAARHSTNEVLTPANFNSIGQIVIAGHLAAVERAIILAKQAGAKLAVLIPVSVPSHCALMQPAAIRLSKHLASIHFKTPEIPVICNVDVAAYQEEKDIRDGLTRQLFMPVRWVETIQYMAKAGITGIIECGPGKVLTGLNKRIDKNLHYVTSSDSAALLQL